MSARNFSLQEWVDMTDSMRILSVVAAGERIRELEGKEDELRELLDSTRDQVDVQRRRIDIARVVLDEGCMAHTLERIAEILWPVGSRIDKPTEL